MFLANVLMDKFLDGLVISVCVLAVYAVIIWFVLIRGKKGNQMGVNWIRRGGIG